MTRLQDEVEIAVTAREEKVKVYRAVNEDEELQILEMDGRLQQQYMIREASLYYVFRR